MCCFPFVDFDCFFVRLMSLNKSTPINKFQLSFRLFLIFLPPSRSFCKRRIGCNSVALKKVQDESTNEAGFYMERIKLLKYYRHHGVIARFVQYQVFKNYLCYSSCHSSAIIFILKQFNRQALSLLTIKLLIDLHYICQ